MTNRYSLLVLLNALKEDDLGDKAHPFTMAQLNYFCHPTRNAKHYKVFTIPKKSGGVREISAPVKMLKSFQTYTNMLLQALYEPTSAAMGFVPGRSVVDNAEKHVGMNYVLNLDLNDFFPSIPQARVWGALMSKAIGFNQDVASAVAGLCCTEIDFYDDKPVLTTVDLPKGTKTEKRNVLPQGAPTSPILTNIVARNLDRQLKHLAAKFGLNYTRYADDITFSCDTNIFNPNSEFCIALRRIVQRDNRFVINKQKTRIQSNNHQQEVTGIIVNQKVNIKKHYVKQLRMWLYLWEHYGYDQAQKFFISDYLKDKGHVKKPCAKIENVLCGKLDYLKMVVSADSEMYKKLHSRYMALIAPPKTSENGSITKRAEFSYLKKACVQLEIPFIERIII